jgi:hypothetical protein
MDLSNSNASMHQNFSTAKKVMTSKQGGGVYTEDYQRTNIEMLRSTTGTATG